MKRILLFFVSAILFTSCAVGRKVKYNDLKMNLSEIKTKNISLALLDHREAVIDESRKPNFVGYMRSNVGIAYPMTTESTKDLTEDLSANIVSSLERFGISANSIKTSWKDQESEVKSQLFKTSDDKKILFIFNELHTDGYAIQVLHYKIDLFIFDKNNELLKYKVFDKERKLGGTVAFGAGPYKKYMPEAMTKLFEDMFNDREILDAINKS